MLPEPTLTFTLPSLHDGLPLDCRVFHPQSLSPAAHLNSVLTPSSPASPKQQNRKSQRPGSVWGTHCADGYRAAAIVAHPYAPLGGSFDDNIVAVVSAVLLRLGFVVCTFNFRGAQGSAGRTSWTARPEQLDYMTVVGFIVHYTHYLDPFRHEAAAATSPSLLSPSSPSPEPLSHRDPTPSRRPLILLAGYSYGAFVTTLLPPLHDYSSGNGGKGILSTHFARPRHGTPAAEVRLRAEHLAARQNAILGEEARGRQRMEEERLAAVAAESSASSGQLSPRRAISGSVRVGGEEDVRRNSHDSGHRRTGSHAQHQRHSFDIDRERLRNSVRSLVGKSASPASVGSACGESLAGGTNGKKKSPSDRGAKVRGQDGKGEQDEDDEFLSPVHGMAAPRVAYLLVSPLQGLVTNLATMSFGSVSAAVGSALGGLFSSKRKQEDEDPRAARPSKKSEGQNKSLASQSSQDSTAATADDLEKVLAERKLTENPTLAVYGDGDVFVAARRLRDWATRLRAVENSRFRAREVPGAGHFWVEGRSLYVLRDAVRNFAEGLLVGDCTDDESVQSEGYEPL